MRTIEKYSLSRIKSRTQVPRSIENCWVQIIKTLELFVIICREIPQKKNRPVGGSKKKRPVEGQKRPVDGIFSRIHS